MWLLAALPVGGGSSTVGTWSAATAAPLLMLVGDGRAVMAAPWIPWYKNGQPARQPAATASPDPAATTTDGAAEANPAADGGLCFSSIKGVQIAGQVGSGSDPRRVEQAAGAQAPNWGNYLTRCKSNGPTPPQPPPICNRHRCSHRHRTATTNPANPAS